jgi:hypothetical protein
MQKMNKMQNNLIGVVGKIKVLCKVSNALCSNQERGTTVLGSKVALLSNPNPQSPLSTRHSFKTCIVNLC